MDSSAIVLAAGLGTRMKSETPKVAHKLLGKPMIDWVVDTAHDAGIDNVVCVLGYKKEVTEPLVEGKADVAVQTKFAGTADAVMCAHDALANVHGPVMVLSGDCPLITADTLKRLASVQQERHAAAVVLTMDVDDPFGYGRIVRDGAGQLVRIVEQKDATDEEAAIHECNSGFYCFDSDFLFDALGNVSSDNAQHELYLTDVIEIARTQGRTVVGLKDDDPTECLGVNDRSQLAHATQVMQMRINDAWMKAGVTMLDPRSVWIEPDVRIENDVEILPQTMLSGTTSIASGSVIGPNTRLTNAVVGHDCTVDETVAIGVRIDDDCDCGPRAYLRPGTHLCKGAKAGTHVEIKNSTIGVGSKVPHLSYIGDTRMGDGVNIGAGSITCNYDGVKKNHTSIGDHTFIGSDTMMVAPVAIGNDVEVGAGSVITDDVPDGALALGRARQVVKEGWMEKHRKNLNNR